MLAESAELAEEIDVARAREALERADHVGAGGRGGRGAGRGAAASRRRGRVAGRPAVGVAASSSSASCCWSSACCSASAGRAAGTADAGRRRGRVSAPPPRRCGAPRRGSGWHFGVGRYRGDELAWYRLTSLRPGPTVVVRPHGAGDRGPAVPDGRRGLRDPAGRRRCCAAGARGAAWSWRWPRACSPASCPGWRPPRPAARATARPPDPLPRECHASAGCRGTARPAARARRRRGWPPGRG